MSVNLDDVSFVFLTVDFFVFVFSQTFRRRISEVVSRAHSIYMVCS